MGSSSWSDTAYSARSTDRKAKGTDAFDYDRAVKASGDLKVHDKMNPFGVNMRESRDSAEHPESLAIAVFLDVTGSMDVLPKIMVEKLKPLMALLIKKGYVEHPHVLFGAIGDATSDRVPLQIGQFESGLEMDDDLSRLVLEGCGGGQTKESYELALYFMARHTSIDCFEKRGKKGYLFIVGDEQHYPKVKANEVKSIIGDKLQGDIDFSEIASEVKEKYEVFIIRPNGSQNYRDTGITSHWKEDFSQNVILLEDINTVAETIASTIGVTEGATDFDRLKDDLLDAGVAGAVDSVTTALAPYAKSASKSVAKHKAKIEGKLPVVHEETSVEML